MSLARVKHASELPHALLEILALPDAEQHKQFMTSQVSTWKARNPLVWSGFGVPAKLLRQVVQGSITQTEHGKSWWSSSAVALFLGFSAEDIHFQNEMDEAVLDRDVNFTMDTNALAKRRLKMPKIPRTWQDIHNFLHRILTAYPTWWSTQCQVYQFVTRLLQAMARDDIYQALTSDASWCSRMGPEIVQCCLQIERAEGMHVVKSFHFLHSDYHHIPFYFHHDMEGLVRRCLKDVPTGIRGTYFTGLAPALVTGPSTPAVITGPSASTNGNVPPGSTPGNANPGNPQLRQPGPGRQRQQVERRNPHHHPLIKAFWDGVPADRKGTPIQVICRKVGTSTNQVLALLGLGPQACGGFHLKGACRRPNCTFDHSVQQVPDEGARQVSAKLTEGMAALTAPQA